MFTRGAKLFFGLALAGYLGGLLYGIITNGYAGDGVVAVLTGDGAVNAVLGPITFGYKGGVGDQFGYSVFMTFALACIGMGAASLAFRDGDPEALAELDNAQSTPPVSEPNDLSMWPMVGAFAAGLMVLGLAIGSEMFIAGAALAVIATVEWAVKAWSERATGDPEVNRIIRGRLMHPIELPVAGLVIIGVIVVAFSRILLTATKTQAVWVATALALVIFGVAVLIGTRPQIRRSAVVAALVIGAVAVVGLGIFGAVRGERELEEHGHEGDEASAFVVSDYSSSPALGETEPS